MRVLRAGIELQLDPGWKTYWRYPGDSGVPPRFDFSASSNVRDVQVLWPAPMRFPDGGGSAIGYAEAVVLPLRVTPRDPGLATTLRMKIDYAVCEKLCVPVEGSAGLTLDSSDPAFESLLAANERRVPRRVMLGADMPFAIAAATEQGAAKAKARVVVDVRAPAGAAIDLLAEGPTAGWSLPLPQPVAGAPSGMRRFAFDLDGLPPGAAPKGALLTLTAISGAGAIETTFRLD
jgi:DsbC/DsbD-like thiol-disulfide interchange protein